MCRYSKFQVTWKKMHCCPETLSEFIGWTNFLFLSCFEIYHDSEFQQPFGRKIYITTLSSCSQKSLSHQLVLERKFHVSYGDTCQCGHHQARLRVVPAMVLGWCGILLCYGLVVPLNTPLTTYFIRKEDNTENRSFSSFLVFICVHIFVYYKWIWKLRSQAK